MTDDGASRRAALKLGLALGLVGLAAPATALPATARTRPVIVTVSYPLAYFAERLAGEAAEVRFPVPRDADPSFWRPAIADISAIQGADLIVLNGAGFAAWVTKASLPRSRIVDTSAGFPDRFIATETIAHSHGAEGAHSHTGTASYTWLDFGLAARQARTLAAAMTRSMPERDAEIAEALQALETDLVALDAAARKIGEAVRGVPAITSHPRYQYFGRAYGLALSSVEWDAREAPSEAQWEALEGRIAETGAKLFLWEAEPDPQALERMGGLGLANVVFPPLANRPAGGDFVAAMTESLERLRDAMVRTGS